MDRKDSYGRPMFHGSMTAASLLGSVIEEASGAGKAVNVPHFIDHCKRVGLPPALTLLANNGSADAAIELFEKVFADGNFILASDQSSVFVSDEIFEANAGNPARSLLVAILRLIHHTGFTPEDLTS